MVPPPQTRQCTIRAASKILELPTCNSFEDGSEDINARRYAWRSKLEVEPFLMSLGFGKVRWEAVQEATKDEDAREVESVEYSGDIVG